MPRDRRPADDDGSKSPCHRAIRTGAVQSPSRPRACRRPGHSLCSTAPEVQPSARAADTSRHQDKEWRVCRSPSPAPCARQRSAPVPRVQSSLSLIVLLPSSRQLRFVMATLSQELQPGPGDHLPAYVSDKLARLKTIQFGETKSWLTPNSYPTRKRSC